MDAEEYDLRFIGEDSETPEEVILETLDRLPGDVRSWAAEAVAWFCPPDCNGQAVNFELNEVSINRYFDESLSAECGGRWWLLRIVYIAPKVFEQPLAEQRRVIAHEIAHHWLKHIGGAPKEEYEKREYDVEELVREWGFVSTSRTQPPRP